MEIPINLKINAIQHIGIPVTDLSASVTFYEKLGFSNAMEAGFIENGEQGTCMMMQRGTMIMELYQLPQSQLAAIKARGDGHVDHIAFDVDDINEAFRIVKAGGFNVLQSEPVFLQFWKNGCRFFHISGPDGERLEFNQVL